MQKIRAFIALEMPDAIHHALADVSNQLKQDLAGVPLRWVPVENMHLTLKFLGDILPDQLPAIIQVLERQTTHLSPFELHLNGVGAFPNLIRARVIWVGLEVPESLKAFLHELDTQLSRLGFPKEERGFAPHLTLARVRDHAHLPDLQKIRDVLTAIRVPPIAGSAATISLVRSELRPSGSVYNALSQFVLSDKH